MIGMIICGHGSYANGMFEALQCIAGKQNNVLVANFDTSLEEKVFETKLLNKIQMLSDCNSIFILCDLCGGTPYKTAVKLSLDNPSLSVLGGVNLAAIIELAVKKEYEESIDLLSLIEESKQQMQLFALDMEVTDCEED